MSFNQQLHKLLSETKVKDVHGLANQSLVRLDTSDKVTDAFRTLHNKNVHAAPVWKVGQNEWVGIAEIRDFVAYVLARHDSKQAGVDESTVGQMCNFDQRPNWIAVYEHSSLENAFSKFHRTSLHRLPVLGADNTLHAMISQLSLVGFLDEHKAVLGDLVNSPVSLLNLGNSSEFIFSVMLHTKLIQVYRFLVQAGVSGVAVVDKESRLVGNISLSDLYKSVSEHLTQPDVTVEHYISSTPGRHFPIYCHPSTPFGEVLSKLHSAKVYRIFVCDSERRVRGIITLSDIVNFVADKLLKQ